MPQMLGDYSNTIAVPFVRLAPASARRQTRLNCGTGPRRASDRLLRSCSISLSHQLQGKMPPKAERNRLLRAKSPSSFKARFR